MLLKNLIGRYGSEVEAVLASIGMPLPEAAVFFVDSGATLAQDAADGEHGNTWSRPFATLNYAISKCTASRGDIILLAPGHAETIEDTGTASGSITDECVLDKAGITVIGVGNGSLIPTFTLEGATDAAIIVTAPSCRISRIKVVSNLADVAIGISTRALADGLQIDNCIFADGAAAKELVIGINLAADCDNCIIENNRFSTVPSGGCANAIVLAGGSDNSIIRDNIANGTYSAGAFLATAAASINLTLLGNIFCNQGAIAVDLHTSTTGIMAKNYLAGTTSIAAVLTDVDGMWLFENYASGEDNKSGLLDPAADGDG